MKLLKALFLSLICSTMLMAQNKTGLMWKAKIGKSVTITMPIVTPEKTFAVNDKGVLTCMETKRGKIIWVHNTGNAILKTPLYHSGTLYVCSKEGSMLSLNEKYGEENWVFKAGHDFRSTPVFYENHIYVNHRKTFYGIDPANGLDIWKAEYPVKGHPDFYISNDILVFEDDMKIVGIDMKTRKEKWTYTVPLFGISELTLEDEKVFFINGPHICALNISDGSVKWTYKVKKIKGEIKYFNKPCYHESVLYCNIAGMIMALNANSGSELWLYKNNAVANFGAPLVFEDRIYQSDRGQQIFSLQKEDGKKENIIHCGVTIASNQLTIQNSIAYFYTDDGFLISYRIQ
jgi:outer membrane protein assembly factor BamB